MIRLRQLFLLLSVAVFMLSAGACKEGQKPGSAEQAGKEIDKAVGEAGQKVGEALEQAGEAMKKAGEEMKKKESKN